jgi:glycine cleavage system H protein
VTGEVVERNDDAVAGPEVLNASPYADAWLIKIKVSDQSGLDNLMSPDEYEKFLEEVGH